MRWLAYYRAAAAWLTEHKAATLGFAVATAYWPGMFSAAFVPRWAVVAVGVPLAADLDPIRIPDWCRWLLLFLLAACAVSLLGSPDPRMGGLELIYIVLLCGAFLWGAQLETLDDLMTGLAVGLGISTVGALYYWWDLSGAKPSGLFYNPEVFAEFAALVAVWTVVRGRWWLALLALPPVLICSSRIAMMATAGAILWAFRPRSKALMAVLALAFVAVSIGSVLFFSFHKAASADYRLTIWGATIMAMTPAGNGLGWFDAAHPAEEFAHSDVLQALAEIGLPAVLLAAIPIMAFAGRQGNRAERAVFFAGCLMVCVSFPLHMPAQGFVIAVVAGHLLGIRPLLGVGDDHSRTYDEGAFRRSNAPHRRNFGFGGCSGGAESAGSNAAGEAALCAAADRVHPSVGAA